MRLQGQPAPEAPPFPDMSKQVVTGIRNAARELAIRLVRRVYEHISVWRLGARRAEPFLRDAVAWISHVLYPMHKNLPASKRAVKYGFAMLHGNALFYAADCTVSTAMQLYGLRGELRRKQPLQAVGAATRVVCIQVVRCSTVLVVTSVFAALGSLAKPGIGTKVGSQQPCDFCALLFLTEESRCSGFQVEHLAFIPLNTSPAPLSMFMVMFCVCFADRVAGHGSPDKPPCLDGGQKIWHLKSGMGALKTSASWCGRGCGCQLFTMK